VGLVTWLGDDADGQACLRSWTEAGVDPRGVIVAPGQASPRCFLFYDPAGGATCYYHPSGSAALRLGAAGRKMAASARALAVTVGPAALTEELLALRRTDQLLAWNVKADANAFPLELRRRLAREANVICLNRGELPFVAAAVMDSQPLFPAHPSSPTPSPRARGEGGLLPAPGSGKAPLPAHGERGRGEGCAGRRGESQPPQRDASHLQDSPQQTEITALTTAIQKNSGGIVVVTAGAAGYRVAWPGGVAEGTVVPVPVTDPTGAGDAFFGAFVAGWLSGNDPPEAAAFAAEYVGAFLRERAALEETA
jgi:sugar/nucleoside kinase (ribokinase family)